MKFPTYKAFIDYEKKLPPNTAYETYCDMRKGIFTIKILNPESKKVTK